MTITENIVYAVIEDIRNEKDAAHRAPDHACYMGDHLAERIFVSLRNKGLSAALSHSDIRRILNVMAMQGYLRTGRTLNDDYYAIPETIIESSL